MFKPNSKWAGSKIWGLKISTPKGNVISKEGLEGSGTPSDILEMALKRGLKRLEYRETQLTKLKKHRRVVSPWKKGPGNRPRKVD